MEHVIGTARELRDRYRKGGSFEDCEIEIGIRETEDADRLVIELLIDGRTVPDWLGSPKVGLMTGERHDVQAVRRRANVDVLLA